MIGEVGKIVRVGEANSWPVEGMREIGEGEPGGGGGRRGSPGVEENGKIRGIRGEIGGGGSTGRTTERFVEGLCGRGGR